WYGLNIVTVKSVPKALTIHAAPDFTHVLGLQIIKLLGGDDLAVSKAHPHIVANAWHIGQLYLK
ncbi:hypothetical protein, partial [Ochrobactrum sp. SFR4]|uniref:hypothetical protein n=1 Tax=Ochrobactrum sp. SFR4 TaxID=2717368 RepID=UPI001C8B611F